VTESPLLGGLAPREFLRRYWQKRPLFVRGALPGFAGVVSRRALERLATRDDVESRIVERHRGRRQTRHGPFARVTLKETHSTLLVNGVNLHVPGADRLLQRFSFVPQARLDDVMVSYATPGGGVGPHVDNYDVFLLQGPGRRAWRVEDKRLVARPGDLLYLPPKLEHDGVALDACFTYSIGFRAPRGAELGSAFLDWLHERGLPEADYRDPGLFAGEAPGADSERACEFCRGRSGPHPVVARRRRALSRRVPERAQAARRVQGRERQPRASAFRGETRSEDAAALPRPPLLHQWRDRRAQRN
jgi:50S ribosomal protein L16 3-hydroxylase